MRFTRKDNKFLLIFAAIVVISIKQLKPETWRQSPGEKNIVNTFVDYVLNTRDIEKYVENQTENGASNNYLLLIDLLFDFILLVCIFW